MGDPKSFYSNPQPITCNKSFTIPSPGPTHKRDLNSEIENNVPGSPTHGRDHKHIRCFFRRDFIFSFRSQKAIPSLKPHRQCHEQKKIIQPPFLFIGHSQTALNTLPTSSTSRSFCLSLDLTSSIFLIVFLS